jgi:hypothetical protein
MSFAALETRANAAVMRRLANARARRVGDATDFAVIFDRRFVEVAGDVGATYPVATAQDSDLTGFASNETQVEIGAVTYTVRDIQPDGTGMSVLVLEVV